MKPKYCCLLAAAACAFGAFADAPNWNVYSQWFIFPPTFDIPEVKGATSYRYRILDDLQLEHLFTNDTCKAPLDRVWSELPNGFFTCICEGLDEHGESVGLCCARRGWKRAAFKPGSYPPKARGYDEAASKVYDYIFDLDSVRYFREHGEPDPAYKLNCYPAKIQSALIRAMVGYAKLRPERKVEALDLARKLANYLLAISEPAGAPTEFFPPTYETNPKYLHHTAKRYAGQTMLLYPSNVGRAYLMLAAATGEAKYREAAVRIGNTYLKLQGPDGTWPLKVYLKDAKPVCVNRAFPTVIAEFLDDLFEATGNIVYREAADRSMKYIEQGPMVDFNWEGQFEDVRPTEKYCNLTKHPAAEACIYLMRRHPNDAARLAKCREVMRFCEDQFVLWERPCHADGVGIRTNLPGNRNDRTRNYLAWNVFPSVTEQYFWNIPIDASSAKMIRAFISVWRAGHDETDMAKARALGDALTRAQLPSGRIPTHFDSVNLNDAWQDWLNCMIAAAEALDQLADATRKDDRR